MVPFCIATTFVHKHHLPFRVTHLLSTFIFFRLLVVLTLCSKYNDSRVSIHLPLITGLLLCVFFSFVPTHYYMYTFLLGLTWPRPNIQTYVAIAFLHLALLLSHSFSSLPLIVQPTSHPIPEIVTILPQYAPIFPNPTHIPPNFTTTFTWHLTPNPSFSENWVTPSQISTFFLENWTGERGQSNAWH